MSEIALYEVLKQIPNITDEEAKEAVGGIASAATKSDIKDMATKSDIKDMATKSDIKDMATKDYLDAKIAKLETSITWRLIVGLGIVVAILKFLP